MLIYKNKKILIYFFIIFGNRAIHLFILTFNHFIIMEERLEKQNFLQLQFCLLLVACTLLPDFNSLFGVLDFDISVFITKIIGIIGGSTALYYFYKKNQPQIPITYISFAGGGLLLSVLTLIPNIPTWLGYISLIALIIALFTSKNNLKIEWIRTGSQGAYLILIAILLHIYDSIGDTILTGIAALIGLIIYFIGLGKIKESLDINGIKGISKLKVSIILSIIAVIFGWIPLLGGIIAGILLIIAFIFEYLGYSNLKTSEPLGEEGQKGAAKLCTSMIIMLIASIVDIIPATGIVVSILSLIALWFVFKGWNMILLGMENKIQE